MLTQQVLLYSRQKIGGSESASDVNSIMHASFMKSYMNMLPQPGEQSNIVFWDQDVLNEIDSEHLKQAYGSTHAYYRSLYDHLINGETSPYKESAGLMSYAEFLWAFNTVSSRHVVMHKHEMDKDPNLLLLMMPLLDILNHSSDPNVAILPHRDTI